MEHWGEDMEGGVELSGRRGDCRQRETGRSTLSAKYAAMSRGEG